MPKPQLHGGPRSDRIPVFFNGISANEAARHPPSQILACVDDDPNCVAVVRHSLAIGSALGLPIALAHVVDALQPSGVPADPLEWHLRLNECRERLDRIVPEGPGKPRIDRLLLTGSTAQELNGWAQEHIGALLVLATSSGHGSRRGGLGSTAEKILARGLASLLLIPSQTGNGSDVHFRKLLVPLDGSCRAESVLPVAVRLARATSSELVLAHVLPRIETMGDNALAGDITCDLCARLMRHNEAQARAYLDNWQSQLWKEGVSSRALVETSGDPREVLRQMALRHQVDLIVLSSHGHSSLKDVACGSVAHYLTTHAPCPVLVIRPEFRLGPTAPALTSERSGMSELAG